MKLTIYASLLFAAMLTTGTVEAQKYKTAADTLKLNKEYLEVSQDVSNLSIKLTEAQNDLPGIVGKAGSAQDRAQAAADNSSNRADQATDGSVKDARQAKRSAKTAYKKAKTSQSADYEVRKQEKKIEQLSKQLNRKQNRMKELEEMRAAIYSKMVPAQ